MTSAKIKHNALSGEDLPGPRPRERSLYRTDASVMLFNSETKTWEYAGGVSGISRVHVYHNNLDNLYRIEGRRLDDSQATINCIITKHSKCRKPIPRFVQWWHERRWYGFYFSSPDGALSFSNTVCDVIENLDNPQLQENEQAEALEETSPRSVELLDPTLQENSCVELQISGKLRYGVIRWIGKDINVWGDVLFAGLELEEPTEGGTDGKFAGNRYFYCLEGRGFFVKLSSCKKDSRFIPPGFAEDAVKRPRHLRAMEVILGPGSAIGKGTLRRQGCFKGGQINRPDLGMTALQMAALHGYEDITEFLLSKGADASFKDENGNTAFHLAAQNNKLGIGKLLLGKGIDIDAQNSDGLGAIHFIVLKGHLRLLEWLLNEQCDVNLQDKGGNTPLHYAMNVGNVEVFRILTESHDVDFRLTNNNGLNILHHAVLTGRDTFVEMIIKREPRLINVQRADGFSPLHMAVEKKYERIVKILLQTGSCKTDSRTRTGQTPLMFAAAGDNLTIVNYLVDAGADLKAFAVAGDTAVHTALFTCDLAQLGNITVEDVINALHNQSECNGFIVACLLAKAGADIEQCNHAFQTPEDLCRDPRLQSVLRQFKEMSLSSRDQPTELLAANCSEKSCRICSEDVYAKLDPCGHSSLCYDCAVVLFKACPECKVQIKNVKPVLDSLPMCKVCNEERSNVRYLPCGHTAACFGPVPEETIPEQLACKICYERRSDAVFLCGHSTCSACAQPLRNCPFCREPIERVIRAYNI